jgi:hypothetical protein
MAICRLLQNSTMEPEDVSRITAAYEQTLRVLCVKDRDDPLTEMIAKKISVQDPRQISARAIKELGVH